MASSSSQQVASMSSTISASASTSIASAITTAAQRPLPMYSRPIHNVNRVATQFRQIPSVSTYPPPPRPFPNSSMNSNYAVGHNHLMSPSNGTMVVPQAQYNRGNVSVNRRRNQRIPIPWSIPGVIDRAVEIVWLNKFWDVNTRLTLRKNKELTKKKTIAVKNFVNTLKVYFAVDLSKQTPPKWDTIEKQVEKALMKFKAEQNKQKKRTGDGDG